MVEAGIVVILVFAVALLGYSLFMAIQNKKKLSKNITTKGMNGLAGASIALSCPAGQVISFDKINTTSTRGALVCLGDASCDGFFQPGVGQGTSFFNPSTTIDVFATNTKFDLKDECEGKQSCSWTVPNKSDSRLPVQSSTPGSCLAKCAGNMAFIGTYDCKAAQ
jgi:hypothetical protein